ncbi:MAG: (2Fe-2S)-binding protein, partial [Pseudomonadota bacterium]
NLMVQLRVNGTEHSLDADPDMPLLWALRDELGLTGTKFGCGVALCGACTVHLDGVPVRSCSVTLADADGAEVRTIEEIDGKAAEAVQAAWQKLDVAQCGYCQSGQIMRAAALLADNPSPTRQQIVDEMTANLCRCGTYNRIFKAVERAAREV